MASVFDDYWLQIIRTIIIESSDVSEGRCTLPVIKVLISILAQAEPFSHKMAAKTMLIYQGMITRKLLKPLIAAP
jgi:hypothetical protein